MMTRWPSFALVLLASAPAWGQAAPHLLQVRPLGGQRGAVLDVEILGQALEGSYAVWLGAGTQLYEPSGQPRGAKLTRNGEGLQAHIQSLDKGGRALVQLAIALDAAVGPHTLYLVSPGGLSNGLPFWVLPHAVIQETTTPHGTPEAAQPVCLPVAVSGRLPEHGQIDYYRFDVEREQTLEFAVVAAHGQGFDPQLALYDSAASWLDPHRTNRLVFHEERTQGGMPRSRRLTYHFTRPGRYAVGINSIFARGGDFTYLLRIAPAGTAAPTDALAWAKGRLAGLYARTVAVPASPEKVPPGATGQAPQTTPVAGKPAATPADTSVLVLKEQEPNDTPAQAASFTIPAVLEGTVGKPGDIDCFRFTASAGHKLVLEVDTPNAQPPQLNPRVDVVDSAGTVVLTNLRVQQGQVSQVLPRVVGALEKGGTYCDRVRDLTPLHGSPDHRYRVFVRPQVPHASDTTVQGGECINLVPGAAVPLTLATAKEEGFAGDFAVAVEGLPSGVTALFGTAGSTVVFHASADAPPTPLPQVARITGRPVVAGKVGAVRKV
jgi:hypothetical protein